MRERRQGRSGLVVFGLLAFVLLGGIGATVLLANDHRNLNLILARFGYGPIDVLFRKEETPHPHEVKGNRMPRPVGLIPERLLIPTTPNPAQFVRTIRKDPEALCEALRQGGFETKGWQAGLYDKRSWECQSYRTFADAQDGENGPSSVFVSIRGDAQTRVSTFRVKLNIENPATQNRVTDTVIHAIAIFLDEVRWQEAPDILADIRSLKEFDIIRFGNRLQLRKEKFGDTPRYNFTITPDLARNRGSYLPDYFDRPQWLPLPEKM